MFPPPAQRSQAWYTSILGFFSIHSSDGCVCVVLCCGYVWSVCAIPADSQVIPSKSSLWILSSYPKESPYIYFTHKSSLITSCEYRLLGSCFASNSDGVCNSVFSSSATYGQNLIFGTIKRSLLTTRHSVGSQSVSSWVRLMANKCLWLSRIGRAQSPRNRGVWVFSLVMLIKPP